MKKFLAGFLAVVMLLTGLSLTAFAANEGAKVPDATITVDAEGVVTVKLANNRTDMTSGYAWIYPEGQTTGDQYVNLRYDSVKKAYIGQNEEIANGTVQSFGVSNYQYEYDEDYTVENSSSERYSYSYYNGNLSYATYENSTEKQTKVEIEYTDEDGNKQTRNTWVTVERKSDRSEKNYNTNTGKLSSEYHTVSERTGDEKGYTETGDTERTSYSSNNGTVSSTATEKYETAYAGMPSQYGYINYRQDTRKSNTETKYYNTDGEYTGKYISDTVTKYDTASDSWTELSSSGTSKRYNELDVLEYETTSASETTYNEAKDARTYNYKSDTSYYNDHGGLTSTGKAERVRVQKLVDGYWETESNVYTSKSYNPKGVLISSNDETEKGNVYTSVQKEYDAYTGQATYEYQYTRTRDADNNYQYTYTTAYNNDDGTLRYKTEQADGVTKYYNSTGALEFIYESRYDEKAEQYVEALKDANGKVLTNEPWSYEFNHRTGKLNSYQKSESKSNEDGTETVTTWTTYDGAGNVKSTSKETVRYNNETNEIAHYSGNNENPWMIEKSTDLEDGKGVEREVRYFNSNGKLTYTEKTLYENGSDASLEVRDADGQLTYKVVRDEEKDDYVLYDKNGKEVASGLDSIYDSYFTQENEDGSRITWDLERGSRIYGGEKREYTSNGNDGNDYTRVYTRLDEDLAPTATRTEKVVTKVYEDRTERNTYDAAGQLVAESVSEYDADGDLVKTTTTDYRLYDYALAGITKTYYDTDFNGNYVKNYSSNGNLYTYGWRDYTNDYYWSKNWYTNGNLASEYYYDQLEGSTDSYDANYYYNGQPSSMTKETADRYESSSWRVNGTYSRYSVTENGITNTTTYDKNGNVTSYTWNQKTDADGTYSYERWDASKLLYTYVSANGKSTRTDADGNVMEYTYDENGTSGWTVTLKDTSDGWKNAFGNSWFYVEGGKPVTGWKQIGGSWYYFSEDGEMLDGTLFEDDGVTYALDENGVMAKSGWVKLGDSSWAYLDANGNPLTGWQYLDGAWYYFTDGWSLDTGYYGNEKHWEQGIGGYMVSGGARSIWNSDWATQHTYFFNDDGTMDATDGWKVTPYGEWHYYQGGADVTGWKEIDGKWYDFDANGVMKVGTWDGDYYLNEDGTMAGAGWLQERYDDDWYYLDVSGKAVYGWQEIGGSWYYFQADGTMATGSVTIDGRVNNFDASGVWLGYGD